MIHEKKTCYLKKYFKKTKFDFYRKYQYINLLRSSNEKDMQKLYVSSFYHIKEDGKCLKSHVGVTKIRCESTSDLFQ